MSSRLPSRNTAASRGMAVASAMILLFLLMSALVIGIVVANKSTGGAMTQGNTAMRSAGMRMEGITAFNTAETGVAYTIQWLTIQGTPPSSNSGDNGSFAPTFSGTNVSTIGNPSRTRVDMPVVNGFPTYFTIRLYPDRNNANNVLKRYLIESTGFCRGQQRILQVFVQQKSFAGYVFFEDRWNGGRWGANERYYDGPVHINNVEQQITSSNPAPYNTYNQIGLNWYTDGSPLDQTGGRPIFNYKGRDAFSTSDSSINWGTNDANGRSPATDAEWKKVSSGGADSVKWGTPRIPPPTNNDMQRIAALGFFGLDPADPATAVQIAAKEAQAKASVGVTVTANGGSAAGGIYINGDVKQVELDAVNKVKQIIKVDQYVKNAQGVNTSRVYTVVTVDPISNTTTVQKQTTNLSTNVTTSAPTQTISGTGNGAVYINGNVGDVNTALGGIKGVVADNYTDDSGNILKANRMTIATNENSDLVMNGSITYLTRRKPNTDTSNKFNVFAPEDTDTDFVQKAGTLGIVSRYIKVSDRDSTSQVAGNTGKAPEAGHALTDIETDAAVFALRTYDCYNQQKDAKGNAVSRSGQTHTNMGCYLQVFGGNTQSMLMRRLYDQRLANNPPPYFPTTGNRYDVLSWQRADKTLE